MGTLVWFRRDLRLHENPALKHALQAGGKIDALYVDTADLYDQWRPGGASRWYLHHSLLSLQRDLAGLGIRLHTLKTPSPVAIVQLASELDVEMACWNVVAEPLLTSHDRLVSNRLNEAGVRVEVFHDDTLLPPGSVCKADGSAYRVFTPFWRRARELIGYTDPALLLQPAPPRKTEAIEVDPACIDRLELLEHHGWHEKLHAWWQPGEQEARHRLEEFLAGPIHEYDTQRDIPSNDGTSRLSASLHFGEISVHRVYARCTEIQRDPEFEESHRSSVLRFLSEIGWREFARHVLHANPGSPDSSMDPHFESPAAWEKDDRALSAWQHGQTGIALVDAGMRQLWETGWMHNRVRMVCASFLVKNLGIHWRNGAQWFWDTLVDADLANNTLGWQWVAGCGTDAAPYYRVFNPEIQAQRYDNREAYIAHWLNGRKARTSIVDLKSSRLRALQRYAKLKTIKPADQPLPRIEKTQSSKGESK